MAELTGGGASGMGGDTATGIWYPSRYWKLLIPLTLLLVNGGSVLSLSLGASSPTVTAVSRRKKTFGCGVWRLASQSTPRPTDQVVNE